MEINQDYVYFSNFILALLEYTKSGEQINNKKKKRAIIIINKFRLLGVQAGRALACFCFFCFCFFVENKAGTKISVGEISQAEQPHIQDLSPTRCTTSDNPTCRKT